MSHFTKVYFFFFLTLLLFQEEYLDIILNQFLVLKPSPNLGNKTRKYVQMTLADDTNAMNQAIEP